MARTTKVKWEHYYHCSVDDCDTTTRKEGFGEPPGVDAIPHAWSRLVIYTPDDATVSVLLCPYHARKYVRELGGAKT